MIFQENIIPPQSPKIAGTKVESYIQRKSRLLRPSGTKPKAEIHEYMATLLLCQWRLCGRDGNQPTLQPFLPLSTSIHLSDL